MKTTKTKTSRRHDPCCNCGGTAVPYRCQYFRELKWVDATSHRTLAEAKAEAHKASTQGYVVEVHYGDRFVCSYRQGLLLNL
jgi:hypothetical protein